MASQALAQKPGVLMLLLGDDTASCTYAISPTSGSFGASGGSESVSVTASNSNCTWTTTNSLSWVSLSSTSGTGSRSVTVTIDPNTGAARSGSVTITDKTYSTRQEKGNIDPGPGKTWTDPTTGMQFVWVPGGCYMMGCGAWTDNCSDNEKPVHEVCLDGFWIGKYEVTQGQWTQIMGSNPFGNLISQHLANFYQGPLDHWIKETRKTKGYVRYMDDFLLFARDKARLTLELAEIAQFLDTRLALQLKANIQLNSTVLGVPFLGFRVFPAHIRLLPRTRLRFSRKLQEYEKKYLEGTWTEPGLVRHVQPLVAFTDAGDSTPFRRMVIQRFGVLS